jgi:hypothetical protein
MSTISSGTTLTTALVQIGDTTGDLVIKTGASNTTAMTISGSSQSVVLAVPLPAASGGTGATSFPSPGTAGNVLTSNGTAWTSAVAAGFPTGTVLIFGQTAAPTGWTKDTTNFNDSALRVVTGTVSSGGTQGFTTAFASQAVAGTVSTSVNNTTATNQNTTAGGSLSINTSGLSAGATTLTTAQMPSHKHDLNKYYRANIFYPVDYGSIANGESTSAVNSDAIANTGGGGSHSHSISGSATGTFTGTAHSHTQDAHNHTASSSFTGTAINLAVKYVDVIRATKD